MTESSRLLYLGSPHPSSSLPFPHRNASLQYYQLFYIHMYTTTLVSNFYWGWNQKEVPLTERCDDERRIEKEALPPPLLSAFRVFHSPRSRPLSSLSFFGSSAFSTFRPFYLLAFPCLQRAHGAGWGQVQGAMNTRREEKDH